MDDLPPPAYRFFQSAFIDPGVQNTLPKGPPPPKKQRCDSLHHRTDFATVAAPARYTTLVTVGSTPSTQRTYSLPVALLSRHSRYFRPTFTDASTSSITLTSTTPSTFQDFVDYMHSSIYSPHKHAPEYHPVLSHAQAWVLGQKLEASVFTNAAIDALHAAFEPLAREQASKASESPITAEHIRWVCEKTEPESILRHLFFDAVASHWMQYEVLNIGYQDRASVSSSSVVPQDSTTWLEVYNNYPDFRKRLASSLPVGGVSRSKLFKSVQHYLGSTTELEEDENMGSEAHLKTARRHKKQKRAGLFVRKRRTTEWVEGAVSTNGAEHTRGRGLMRQPSVEIVFGGSESGFAVHEDEPVMANNAAG